MNHKSFQLIDPYVRMRSVKSMLFWMSVQFISVLLILITFSISAKANTVTPYTRPDFILPTEISDKMERDISLDLRDISVLDVLKFLSTKAELNIVASQNITGRVNLFLKNVSIASALEVILVSANLAMRVKSGILYVMTEEEYLALYGESFRDQRAINIIQLLYADPTKVGQILEGLKSAIGKVIIDVQTATLVLIDTQEKLRIMTEMIKNVDIPTVERQLPTKTQVYELSYGSADDLFTQITPLLTEGVGQVQSDIRTNRLVVKDFPHVIREINGLVDAFDRKTRQVLIEAKIYQIRLNNRYQMGVNWQQVFNQGEEREKFTIDTSATFGLTTTSGNSGQVVLGNIGREDFLATINMLQTFGDTKTIAQPHIAVESGEEAEIVVGTREAFVTSTVSQADSTTTTSESVTFIDVGVKMKVTPVINKDGFVSMKIAPEVSSTGTPLVTANGNSIPIVDTTNASTQVLVKDGHTVMIGGLMQDDISKSVRKVPVLGDIPLIGSAFRFTDDDSTKTELVLFLTPHIIEGDEPRPFSATGSAKPLEDFRSFDSSTKPFGEFRPFDD